MFVPSAATHARRRANTMNPELDLVPWTDWLVVATISFVIVTSLLAVAGLIVGYLSLVIQYGFSEANDRFIFFLGTVGRDVVAFSPRRTYAIAYLTALESWRRRHLVLALGLFFVFLLLGAWYVDSDSEQPAKIYLTTVMWLSSGLILVFALVFSSIGLWTEFRTKTSLPLITKPVRGGEIVLGRILGVVAVCTVLIAVMGLTSYIFVVRGVSHSHTIAGSKFTLVDAKETGPGRRYRGETVYNDAAFHGHEFEVNSSGRGRTEWRKGHWHPIAAQFDARGLWEITFDDGVSPQSVFMILTGSQEDPAVTVAATRPAYEPGGAPAAGGESAGYAQIRNEAFTATMPAGSWGQDSPGNLVGELELPLPDQVGSLLRGSVSVAGTADAPRRAFLARQVVPDSDAVVTLLVGPHAGMLEARVPIYAPETDGYGNRAFYFTDRQGEVKDRGINVGNEWEYRGYIEGDTKGSIVWTFEGLSPEQFPDGLPIELDIRVFRSRKGNITKTIRGSLQFLAVDENNVIQERSRELPFNSQEFTLQRIQVPKTITSSDGQRELNLFGDVVRNGRVQIVLRCEEHGQYFGAARRDLYIRSADLPFGWNFAKAYFGLWLQMIMMVCLGTLFSTRLHFIVAMMASAFVLVIGYGELFIAGVYRGVLENLTGQNEWMGDIINRFRLKETVLHEVYISDPQLGGGMIEAGIRIARQTNLTSPLDLPFWLVGMIQWTDFLLTTVVYLITWLIPDFDVFSLGDLLSEGRNINANILGRQAGMTLGYLVVLPIFGYFFLRTREVAQ